MWTLDQNCYGYVLDKPEWDSLFPGELAIRKHRCLSAIFAVHSHGISAWDKMFLSADTRQFKDMTLRGAAADDLVSTGREITERKGYYPVGLYFGYEGTPDMDFHWTRRDRDGVWSFKICAALPERLTENGRPVNPAEASFEGYKFWGYFLAPGDAPVFPES